MKVVVAVIAVVAMIVVARQLPPAPGVGLATEAGTSVAMDPNAVLTVAPTPSGTADAAVDPFATVVIDPGVSTATLSVGQSLSFAVPDEQQSTIQVSSDRPDILDVYAGTSSDGFDMLAGGDAYAPGTATITIRLADGAVSNVVITVTE